MLASMPICRLLVYPVNATYTAYRYTLSGLRVASLSMLILRVTVRFIPHAWEICVAALIRSFYAI